MCEPHKKLKVNILQLLLKSNVFSCYVYTQSKEFFVGILRGKRLLAYYRINVRRNGLLLGLLIEWHMAEAPTSGLLCTPPNFQVHFSQVISTSTAAPPPKISMPSFRDETWVTKFYLPYNCWNDLIFVSLWNIQRYPTHLDVGKGQRSMCCWRMLPFGIIQDHPRPFVTNEVFTGAVDQVDLYRAADATEWVNEMLGDSSCALLDLGV